MLALFWAAASQEPSRYAPDSFPNSMWLNVGEMRSPARDLFPWLNANSREVSTMALREKSGRRAIKGLLDESGSRESSYASKPCPRTSIQQTTIDVNGNCDVHPNSFGPPYPPVILLGPPASYLSALRTPSEDCLYVCVSCLQIECFYGQSLHCDFLPYDIDTIQPNLLLQLSCISASHVARRVHVPCR